VDYEGSYLSYHRIGTSVNGYYLSAWIHFNTKRILEESPRPSEEEGVLTDMNRNDIRSDLDRISLYVRRSIDKFNDRERRE